MTRRRDRSDSWKDVRGRLLGESGAKEAFAQRYPYAAVANAILELRSERNLTQDQLAQACGTTQSVIARLESGRHPVSVSLLLRIATALGLEWRPVFSAREDLSGVGSQGNVVPLFGSRPTPPEVGWRPDGVSVRRREDSEVEEALDEIQERLEHVKEMFGASTHAPRSQRPRRGVG